MEKEDKDVKYRETKEYIIKNLKEDLRFTIEVLQDKYLSETHRAYNNGYKDALIQSLQLLNAYDESFIDKIKEDYFYKKHEEDKDLPYSETKRYKRIQRSIETDGSEG